MRHALLFTLIGLCAAAGRCRADALDLPTPSASYIEPAPADSVVIGAGAAIVPEYAGGRTSHAVPLPIIERQFGNGFFAGTSRGLGYQATVDGVMLSAALSYGGARADHRRNIFDGSDDLKGMGDIAGSAQATLGLGFRAGAMVYSASTTQNLTHREHGNTYTAGASVPLCASATDQLGLAVSVLYGDGRHAQTWFGISALQSQRSGYSAYQARAGMENVTAGVNWRHAIDKRWTLHGAAGATLLSADAAASPLTRHRLNPMLMASVSYLL